MNDPTLRSAKSWSRTHDAFANPDKEVLRLGALLRIADALESIEKHIFSIHRAQREAQDQKRWDAFDNAVAAIQRRAAPQCPKGVLTPESMANALLGVCGLDDADADDPTCWVRMLNQAPMKIRCWGHRKNEYLREWAQAEWPDAEFPP